MLEELWNEVGFMIPVVLQKNDGEGWILFCEVLDCSLTITQVIGLLETARLYGWTACECGLTDGTRACSHETPTTMLQEALRVLVANVGWEADLMRSPYLLDRLDEVL